MGISFGLAVGGAADGYRKQMAAMDAHDEAKAKKDARKRDDAARETIGGLPVPGQDRAYNYDPIADADARWDAAMDTKPERRGLLGKMLDKLDPEQAAARAKIPTKASVAAQAQAQATEAGLPAPAPGATTPGAVGTGLADMPEIAVKPSATKRYTDADAAIAMYRVAQKQGDKDGMTAAMQAHQKAVQDEAVMELGFAGRTWDGLTNYVGKHTDQDIDYEPIEGTNKARITVNGSDAGEMTLDEARDNVIGMVMKNPDYAAAASTRREQSERAALSARTEASYKQATVAVAKQNADTQSRLADSTVEQNAVETENLKSKRAAQVSFQNMLYDGDDSGDAFLNAPKLAAMSKTAYEPVTKVVQDANGEGKSMVIYPGEDIAKTEIKVGTERFNQSPFVKAGIINVQAFGERRLYVVKGVKDRGFTNLAAAENASRRLYPDVIKKPAGK